MSKIKLKLIFLPILFFSFFGLAGSSQAIAAIVYVDNSSAAIESCSSPLDTDYDPVTRTCGSGSYVVFDKLYNATSNVTAGMTVIIKDGTYSDMTTVGTEYTTAFVEGITGTVDAPILIKSENQYGAKITCGTKQDFPGYYGFAFNGNISYVTIEGFDIHNCTYGSSINNNNDHITFKNNKYHNLTNCMSVGDDCDYATVDSNILYECGGVGYHSHGIYLRGKDGIIKNNLVYHMLSNGWSVHIGTYGTSPTGNWQIINNTLEGSSNDGACIRFYNAPTIDTLYVDNNICFNAPGGLWTGAWWKPTYYARNNLIEDTATVCMIKEPLGTCENCVAPICANNAVNVSAGFIDEENNNYHLNAGSAAIDAGLAVNASSYDVEGTVRPQGTTNPKPYDIGAYEYQGDDTTPPAAPSGLSVN